MLFRPTPIHGAYLIEMRANMDARGFFGRLFCEKEFTEHGLETKFVQINASLSHRKGTLRGLHYQVPPAADVKLVRVTKGAVWDVILDLRPDSPSFGQHYSVELNDENHHTIYIPGGCAHGFITLENKVEALYMVSAFHTPDCERGVRWDDPFHGIEWPLAPTIMSDKDTHWPDFDPGYHGLERLNGMV